MVPRGSTLLPPLSNIYITCDPLIKLNLGLFIHISLTDWTFTLIEVQQTTWCVTLVPVTLQKKNPAERFEPD